MKPRYPIPRTFWVVFYYDEDGACGQWQSCGRDARDYLARLRSKGFPAVARCFHSPPGAPKFMFEPRKEKR